MLYVYKHKHDDTLLLICIIFSFVLSFPKVVKWNIMIICWQG